MGNVTANVQEGNHRRDDFRSNSTDWRDGRLFSSTVISMLNIPTRDELVSRYLDQLPYEP